MHKSYPHLEITCAGVPEIDNGERVYDRMPLPNGDYSYDTEVLYRCNNDFSLSGVTTRRCTGNGESTVGLFDDMAPVCDPGGSAYIDA